MSLTECAIEGCNRPVYARRLCAADYQKARIAGALPPSAAVDRSCARCGESMTERKSARARFCSPACKDDFHSAVKASALAAKRVGRTCEQCKGPISEAVSSRARTCSPACGVAYQNAVRAEAKRAHWESVKPPCKRCGGEISSNRHAGSKYCSPECKKSAMDAVWRERSPGYMRHYLYGVTPDRYAEMLAEQGGSCGICPATDPGGKGAWHVDHNHTTGKVRGLLCHSCNLGLGHFGDDITRLRAAISYLEAHAS